MIVKRIFIITTFWLIFLLSFNSCQRQLHDPAFHTPVSHKWNHPTDSGRNTVISNINPGGLDVFNQEGDLIYRYNIGRVSDFHVISAFRPDGGKTERLIAFDAKGDTLMTLLVDPVIGTLTPLLREPA